MNEDLVRERTEVRQPLHKRRTLEEEKYLGREGTRRGLLSLRSPVPSLREDGQKDGTVVVLDTTSDKRKNT